MKKVLELVPIRFDPSGIRCKITKQTCRSRRFGIIKTTKDNSFKHGNVVLISESFPSFSKIGNEYFLNVRGYTQSLDNKEFIIPCDKIGKVIKAINAYNEYFSKTEPADPCTNKVVVIDGKKYKLTAL